MSHRALTTRAATLAQLTLIGWIGLAAAANAASAVSYVASGDPGANPDANAGAVDVWSVTATDVGGGGAGSYLDGSRGWTIWTSPFGGDPATQTDAIRADHTFAGGPLGVGQSASLRWANSAILGGRAVGVSLMSGGAAAITVKFIGNDALGVYRYDDAGGVDQSTGQGFQFQTLAPFVVSLTSATTYSASYNGTPWSGTYSGTIDGIRVFNDRAADGSDLYFNNLEVTPEPSAAALATLAGLCLASRRRRAR